MNEIFPQAKLCTTFSNCFVEDRVNTIKAKLFGDVLQFVKEGEDLYSGQVTYETLQDSLVEGLVRNCQPYIE